MKVDGLTLIIVIIMTLCLATACFYYYQKKIDTCTSQPLSYASKIYENQIGYEFVGYGWFNTPFSITSPKFYFNSTGLYPVTNPEIIF